MATLIMSSGLKPGNSESVSESGPVKAVRVKSSSAISAPLITSLIKGSFIGSCWPCGMGPLLKPVRLV